MDFLVVSILLEDSVLRSISGLALKAGRRKGELVRLSVRCPAAGLALARIRIAEVVKVVVL